MPCPWGPQAPSREALQRAMGRQRRAAAPAEKFVGEGQALGGATPTPAVEDAPLPDAPVVDASKPIAKFRLRLASGKALAVELNEEHTVGHLRAFIGAQGAGDKPTTPRGLPAQAVDGRGAVGRRRRVGRRCGVPEAPGLVGTVFPPL